MCKKLLIILLVLQFSVIKLQAKTIEDTTGIMLDNKTEIISWAEKYYFGGYQIKEFKINNYSVSVLLGGFTSGAATTEIRVYRSSTGGRWKLLLIRFPLPEDVDVFQSDMGLVFKTTDDKTVLILPVTGLSTWP
jgi:hypothetical protein